ncbi:MAG: hypothetical protein C4530_16915 [Desulfobacteraceae bacterium]|nr:MAG: hypothetical protein C4530_16915 [Desulfobacteraceae bacterium]
MALTDLWENSRQQIERKHVQQIIAFAGDGHLLDGGVASNDFRNFLTRIPTAMLQKIESEIIDMISIASHKPAVSVEAGWYY